jgi:serine/threonine protein phosphatase PrpC
MLTVLDMISLAGDRAKQNDDAAGCVHGRAWVIDGATDLYKPPRTPMASDAAWIAAELNAILHGAVDVQSDPRALLAAAAETLQERYAPFDPGGLPGWARPAASVLLAVETSAGLEVADLGDSRIFAVDAHGMAISHGGPDRAAEAETAMVRKLAPAGGENLLSDEAVLESLRARHATRNTEGGWWVFGPDPACAAHARVRTLRLGRPAHILLATDGFAALVDRYEIYDAEHLLEGALSRGLAALAAELRAIENDDAAGAAHPRFKKSDDATALLIRLE